MDTLIKSILEVIKESGRDLNCKIDRETRLRDDLGMDSLDLAVLTVRLESLTGIDVFANGIVKTVGEIQNRLDAR